MEECSLRFTQKHGLGYALASATQGRSIPADGCKSLNSNLPHLHILK